MCKCHTKTERGDRVDSTREIVEHLHAGRWFYIGDKPVNPKFIINMPLSRIVSLIRHGRLYECISTKTGGIYCGDSAAAAK